MKTSTPENENTLSLYWYLQYFAALGLFALIRLWVLICIQMSMNFGIKNQPKSIKNAIQNRIDFLIEFWTDFFRILAPFCPPFGLHFGSKIVQNGATVKDPGLFGNNCAPDPPRGTPRPSKWSPGEASGPQNWVPMVPQAPRKTPIWTKWSPREAPGP